MLEWFYVCAVTKDQNFSWILHFWYSLFQFLQVFANSCELNPTLAILLILCKLMRLLDRDSPCCTRVIFVALARHGQDPKFLVNFFQNDQLMYNFTKGATNLIKSGEKTRQQLSSFHSLFHMHSLQNSTK